MTLSNSADASRYQDAQEIFDIKESVTWPVEYSAMHACSVTQSCPTLCDPMKPARLLCLWNFPGKNAGVVAIPFSGGSSQTRDGTQVSCVSCLGWWVLY